MLTVDQMIDLEVLARETLQELEDQIKGGNEEAKPVAPDKAIGRLSRLDSMQIQEMAKAADRRKEDRVQELKLALDRMDKGSYGKCNQCAQWIALARLEVQPEAEECTDCARQS